MRRLLDFVRVLKFNPNHDRSGKFSTSGGAGGDSSALPDVSSWKKLERSIGSNPGGVYEDPASGARHFIKFPQRHPEQANAEKLADAIYTALGIPAKDSRLVTADGTLGLASPMLAGSHEIGASGVNASPDIKRGYVADAYLASWDVFGMVYDNILRVGGQDYRVDNGGTLFFRAQGEAKAFPADRVDELDSLIAPGRQGRRAFAGLTDADVQAQAQHLVSTLTDAKLVQLVAEAGLTGDRATAYQTALQGRRDVLAKRFLTRKAEFQTQTSRKKKKKRVQGLFQEVPMDIDAIQDSLNKANS
jgi:hypothetical protein